jgi:hypothetical protein
VKDILDANAFADLIDKDLDVCFELIEVEVTMVSDGVLIMFCIAG